MLKGSISIYACQDLVISASIGGQTACGPVMIHLSPGLLSFCVNSSKNPKGVSGPLVSLITFFGTEFTGFIGA